MGKVKDIYKQNIYGVIGTLVFHIIILIILLLSGLKINEHSIEKEIIVDFNAAEIKPPAPEKGKNEKPEMASLFQQMSVSNQAVNDASKSSASSTLQPKDPFFDKAYNNEIAAARKLVNDVNKTLARKIPEIGDIKMPVDNTEGKTREEVKQSNFKGKSNIHYSLGDRYHIRLPIPVYLAEGGGEVIVDIVVDRYGGVVGADPRPNPLITDLNIFAYARQAAEKTVFNEDPAAPEKQKGTISYRFLAQ